MEQSSIFSRFNGNLAAEAGLVEQFESHVGFKLPKDYVEFIRHSNGGEGFIGPNAYVIFWRLDELEELNKAYQIDERVPGLLVFGSDGGGEAFAFDARGSVVSIPFVGMELDLARPMGASYNEFLEELARI